jgi:hypothetical protein
MIRLVFKEGHFHSVFGCVLVSPPQWGGEVRNFKRGGEVGYNISICSLK